MKKSGTDRRNAGVENAGV